MRSCACPASFRLHDDDDMMTHGISTIPLSMRGPIRVAVRAVRSLALLVLLLSPVSVSAQTLALDNLVVDNQEGRILVRFAIGVEGESELAQLLTSGEMLGLRVSADLSRKRSVWFDKSVADREVLYLLRWDGLKNVFAVLDAGGAPLAEGTDFSALLAGIFGRMNMDLGAWSRLKRDNEYRLALQLRLGRVDVPMWLKRVLFFWNWDAAPSAHYQLEFTY